MRFSRASSIAFMLLLLVTSTYPQEARLEVGRLMIETDLDSVGVTINGAFMGHTPFWLDTIVAGTHILQLKDPDEANWLTRDVIDTMEIQAGVLFHRRYSMIRAYLIASEPFGADVLLRDSLAGRTPIVLAGPLEPLIPLSLRKPGYESVPVDPRSHHRGVFMVHMTKIWSAHENQSPHLLQNDALGSRHLPLYISASATILSGVAAAYFKIKADDRYQHYALTGNPSLHAETQRLDTAAGVALAATQLSLGVFAYFLLSD
jgi:hypothetical protein